MKAREFLDQATVGQRVWTQPMGEWPGGPATITELRPDPGAPEIAFNVRHHNPDVAEEFGEMGVFEHEDVAPLDGPGWIHVHRGPPTTTEAERQQLADLDRYQRRYLSRRICGLCDMPLDRVGCGACMGPACPEDVRIERRAKALAAYRPRPNRRAAALAREAG